MSTISPSFEALLLLLHRRTARTLIVLHAACEHLIVNLTFSRLRWWFRSLRRKVALARRRAPRPTPSSACSSQPAWARARRIAPSRLYRDPPAGEGHPWISDQMRLAPHLHPFFGFGPLLDIGPEAGDVDGSSTLAHHARRVEPLPAPAASGPISISGPRLRADSDIT